MSIIKKITNSFAFDVFVVITVLLVIWNVFAFSIAMSDVDRQRLDSNGLSMCDKKIAYLVPGISLGCWASEPKNK
jgi:ammonia channel protein AmtB